LTVTDNQGLPAAANTTATISQSGGGNQAPTALPGGPYTGTAGTAIRFDGSASSDPDGTIASFQWSFGDGASAALREDGALEIERVATLRDRARPAAPGHPEPTDMVPRRQPAIARPRVLNRLAQCCLK